MYARGMSKQLVLDNEALSYYLARKGLRIYQIPGVSKDVAYKMRRTGKAYTISVVNQMAAGLDCSPLALLRVVETEENQE